jgi:hypothetical protein
VTYSVLVAQKAGIVESTIGVRHAESQTRSGSVRQVVVDEVQVVRPEIDVAERCIRWNSESSRTRTSQAGVQRGCNRQSRSVGVVVSASCRGSGCIVPDDVHLVCRLVVRRRRHTEKCQRTWTRDVELFSVIPWLDQDHIRIVVVRYAEDRCLDTRKVARWSYDQRVLRASF